MVLFIPLGIYAFSQQLATALYFASHCALRPHFLLISDADHRFTHELDAAGLAYSTLSPVRASIEMSVGSLGENNQSWLKAKSQSLLKGFLWWRQLWLRKRLAKRLVRPLAPRCSVVCQERLSSFLPILKALQDLKIPVILMPAAESSPDGSAWPRRDNYSLRAGLKNSSTPLGKFLRRPGITIANRGVQRWLPSQVYASPWGKMLFYSAAQIFLLGIMGMLPRNPWYQGTTFADYIMISGIDESAMYADARVDPAKLLFYGSHELDVLYDRWLNREELRHKLIEEYQLDRNRSIFIVALPPLWEQGMVTDEVHWRSINEILDALSRQDHNVIISLHPSSNRKHYSWIEEKYPVKISREPLTEILVAADIFVAAFSSTIRWAIGLGIPVINLDFWNLNYEMYINLAGYQTVTTVSEFDELIRRLASDPNLDCLSSSHSPVDPSTISREPPSNVLIDGRAKERLLGFIISLDGSAPDRADASNYTEPIPQQHV